MAMKEESLVHSSQDGGLSQKPLGLKKQKAGKLFWEIVFGVKHEE